jgi:colanic acid biosynthesis glycosyl transferase WcaI
MKCLLLCTVFPPEPAPAGVNIAELAEDLAAAGHQVTVITGWPSHPGGKLYPGWRSAFRGVERTPQGYCLTRCGHSFCSRSSILAKVWYYFTWAISSFINGLRAGRADVVLFCSSPVFVGLTSLLLARLKRARSVYWIHDIHPEATRNAGIIRAGTLCYRMCLALDRFVCRRSTLVATLTETMRQTLLARGLDANRVVLLPHWVDAQKISPRSRDNPWRQRHGIGLEQFVVLHAGTMGFISGAGVILDAARMLRERRDLLFLFVGGGALKEQLERQARDTALDNVRFLPFQPAEELADVQATGDVGLVTLLPDTGETSIPSKLHGYTSAARPVIASLASDTPVARMVEEGRFGIVCPSQDAAALAQAITRLADQRELAQQMGQHARDFFLATFDRVNGTQRAIEMLTTLANTHVR